MKKIILGSIAFGGAIILGLTFFMGTFEYQQKRSAASTKNEYDLTCVNEDELSKAITNRIVSGLRGVRRDGFLGIHLGHFILLDPENLNPSQRQSTRDSICPAVKSRKISSAFSSVPKKMACQLYPKIRLSLVADGESANGNKRQLDIETACTVSTDLGRTETFWVPWKQLANESPFEGVSEYNKPSVITVKTFNITDKWPEKWILDRIQMEGKLGQITIDSSQIRQVADRPIIFDFN